MLIKPHLLDSHLNRSDLPAIYILIGKDYFLLTETFKKIKRAWFTKYPDGEAIILSVQSNNDWDIVAQKTNNYTLFATSSLLDIRYSKEKLDTTGYNFLQNYVDSPPNSTANGLGHIDETQTSANLLILSAPNLSISQLQKFTPSKAIHILSIFPLDHAAMLAWIKQQLRNKGIQFTKEIPELIYQYTQGNMLACAQTLEKINLVADKATLTPEVVETQLIDQSQYKLFALADACLAQNPVQVIRQLRHAYDTGIEATLVLWLLAQEARNLMKLIELMQSENFTDACVKLKIKPQRQGLYKAALQRIHSSHLVALLQFCRIVEERIKSSNNNSQVWPGLEKIALGLCLNEVEILA